jgi:hypothetical protein
LSAARARRRAPAPALTRAPAPSVRPPSPHLSPLPVLCPVSTMAAPAPLSTQFFARRLLLPVAASSSSDSALRAVSAPSPWSPCFLRATRALTSREVPMARLCVLAPSVPLLLSLGRWISRASAPWYLGFCILALAPRLIVDLVAIFLFQKLCCSPMLISSNTCGVVPCLCLGEKFLVWAAKTAKANCDACQVLDVKPEPRSHHCSCEVQANYNFERRFGAEVEASSPFILRRQPTPRRDVPVDPDALSASCVPLVLSSEAPVELFPCKPPSNTTLAKCLIGSLNQYSSLFYDY